ncbi:hypothetical protein cypCar_00040841, partial [Cyprinus carpio]
CWITNSNIHYTVNIGYYALVFIFTTGIFIVIVTKIVQARKIKAVDGKSKTFRKQMMMVLSLFLLFGLTWSVAFFSYGPMIIPSYYIFTVLNSLQGELNWRTFGCVTETNISNTIKCSCSHLTFFSVLMLICFILFSLIFQSPPDANITAMHLESLTYISSIGCGISMFFLAIALFMHFLLR